MRNSWRETVPESVNRIAEKQAPYPSREREREREREGSLEVLQVGNCVEFVRGLRDWSCGSIEKQTAIFERRKMEKYSCNYSDLCFTYINTLWYVMRIIVIMLSQVMIHNTHWLIPHLMLMAQQVNHGTISLYSNQCASSSSMMLCALLYYCAKR